MASAGRRAVTVIRRPTGISRARRVRHGQHLVVGWKNNTLQRVGPAGYGQGLGTAENRRGRGRNARYGRLVEVLVILLQQREAPRVLALGRVLERLR